MKFLNILKKYWFLAFLPLMMTCVFNVTHKNLGKIEIKKCETEADKEEGCYIFYGIAQNELKVENKRDFLKVNYLIEGWPAVEHDVFIEIVDADGGVDFLYSEKHTRTHKAHYHKDAGQRVYKAYYKIPHSKLGPGKWKLRVTFRFHVPLGEMNLVSNDIEFIVK